MPLCLYACTCTVGFTLMTEPVIAFQTPCFTEMIITAMPINGLFNLFIDFIIII